MNKLLALFFLLLFISLSYAQQNSTLDIYFFYSETCPHCKAETAFLQKIEPKYPQVSIHYLPISKSENLMLLDHLARQNNMTVYGVPVTFIGKFYFEGFDDEEHAGKYIEDAIINELNGTEQEQSFEIPFIGKVDPKTVSLPLLTIAVGLLDGFNPCAMYVLLFLLALLAHTRSRKKMIMIGGVFIFVEGLVYFLFMAAWLNVYLVVGYLEIITKLAAVIALVSGFLNVKDYFFFGKWFSLKVPEAQRKGIFDKMREIVNQNSIVLALVGVIFLAVSVNIIELICTFGFPAVYTRILSLQNFPSWLYYGYLVLYNIMYMFDDMIVFSLAVWALSTAKFTQKQGEILKFISGWVMLTLGLILLFAPNLLVFG